MKNNPWQTEIIHCRIKTESRGWIDGRAIVRYRIVKDPYEPYRLRQVECSRFEHYKVRAASDTPWVRVERFPHDTKWQLIDAIRGAIEELPHTEFPIT